MRPTPGRIAHRLALAGLAVLGLWLLAAPPSGESAPSTVKLAIGLVCATPILALLATGLRPGPKWGTWVAIVMIPYFALGLGAMLVTPGNRTASAGFAMLIALVFFAGADMVRRR